MTRIELPHPVVRPAAPAEPTPGLEVGALERALCENVDGEVRFDAGSRAAYSTDASNYRQIPVGVVVPRTVEAAAAAMLVCRDHRAAVLARGGGTSLAGQCADAARRQIEACPSLPRVTTAAWASSFRWPQTTFSDTPPYNGRS